MKANVWLSPLTHVCLVLACGALAAGREADYGVSQGLIGVPPKNLIQWEYEIHNL